jgi:hypothetical protein
MNPDHIFPPYFSDSHHHSISVQVFHVVSFIQVLWPNFCTRAIPKSTSDWLVKKVKSREKIFITYKTYIHK